jgi:hypothetical protein
MNRSSLLISMLIVAITAASCSASSKKLDLGGTCVQNSDCNNPLACKFATCHQQCVQSRDCPAGEQCVAAADGSGVCVEPACGANGKACPSPLVCVSNTCVNVCTGGLCPLATQTCISGTCQDTQVAGKDGAAGAGVGVACTLGSDCASPLLCKFGSCHQACASSTDCASGGRCVTANGVAVCQLPVESACGVSGTCAAGLACRTVDNTCRTPCTSSAGCLGGQTCAGTVCVENAESNPGNDGAAGAGGGADAGVGGAGAGGRADAGAAGVGGTAGSGGSMGSTAAVAISVPGLGAVGFNYTQGSYIVGFVFRANRAISITQFGYYDSNLTGGVETFQPHAVGVYDLSTHTLVGSATVQPSDPVTGLFHYVALPTPIAVNTTDNYAIVGVTGTNKYTVGITASEAPTNAAITYVSGAGYGPSNSNATQTSTLVEPNAFDAGNLFGQPTPTGTLCNFGPNFMFVTGSGGSDAGIDAPTTNVGDAAAGSGGSGGSAGGATGPSGRDSGTAGGTGTSCTPGQAPTKFEFPATSDSDPNYTSGVGVLTATELLTFNGYAGPDSTDGGVVDGGTGAKVNRIDVQHFDPITGASKGKAAPLLTAAGDGSGIYIAGAAVAPTGEIAIIYSAATGVYDQYGRNYAVYLTFLGKDLAPVQSTIFVVLGSSRFPANSYVQWLNGEFVASSTFGIDPMTARLGRFGANGANLGITRTIPTDDPAGRVDNEGYAEGEVAFSGSTFAVAYLSTTTDSGAGYPFLTFIDASDALTEVSSPMPLPSSQFRQNLAVAGTSQGFVAVYNGTSSSNTNTLLATYVSNSASGDAGVPVGATYSFVGGFAYRSMGGTRGSSDGNGAGFAALYPDGSVTFLYFSADGSIHGNPQTILQQVNGASDGDEAHITSFAGKFAVSLYSSTEHLTRVITSTCQ